MGDHAAVELTLSLILLLVAALGTRAAADAADHRRAGL